jgi:hypothetical protein
MYQFISFDFILFFNNYLLDYYFAQASLGFIVAVKFINF